MPYFFSRVSSIPEKPSLALLNLKCCCMPPSTIQFWYESCPLNPVLLIVPVLVPPCPSLILVLSSSRSPQTLCPTWRYIPSYPGSTYITLLLITIDIVSPLPRYNEFIPCLKNLTVLPASNCIIK